MNLKDFEIIDFHIHPFEIESQNICRYNGNVKLDKNSFYENLKRLGVKKFCGSVTGNKYLENNSNMWEQIKSWNDTALRLRDYYKGDYVMGYHIHPQFVDESIKEIERMRGYGVNLIGELVPYMYNYFDYGVDGLDEILTYAEKYNLVVSFHTLGDMEIDSMVKKHKNLIFVAAHPGERQDLQNHIRRLKNFDNYYLDLSGTGLFRYGMLRALIDETSVDKILYGSDFPVCSPELQIGGILLDNTISNEEKQKIFYDNANYLIKKYSL